MSETRCGHSYGNVTKIVQCQRDAGHDGLHSAVAGGVEWGTGDVWDHAPTETVEHGEDCPHCHNDGAYCSHCGEDDSVEWAADIFRERDRNVSAWDRGEADLIEDVEWARRILALRSQEPVGWQPIETAPKDGTAVLGWRFFPVAIRWTGHDKYPWESVHLGGFSPLTTNGFEDGDGNLTHWMPLPEPPVGPPIGESDGD